MKAGIVGGDEYGVTSEENPGTTDLSSQKIGTNKRRRLRLQASGNLESSTLRNVLSDFGDPQPAFPCVEEKTCLISE